ncbi:hypothetical protein NDU88_001234 [Pleurodeles waltl]|uniref:Uncharacterized protein n=1 Tax=Pleurodeles waltl TaxID=8319 RepID=A0AAV7LC65_PLEWA|nr:hypothetical protein NDU88_001234 [Pleurodeles waltl]
MEGPTVDEDTIEDGSTINEKADHKDYSGVVHNIFDDPLDQIVFWSKKAISAPPSGLQSLCHMCSHGKQMQQSESRRVPFVLDIDLRVNLEEDVASFSAVL